MRALLAIACLLMLVPAGTATIVYPGVYGGVLSPGDSEHHTYQVQLGCAAALREGTFRVQLTYQPSGVGVLLEAGGASVHTTSGFATLTLPADRCGSLGVAVTNQSPFPVVYELTVLFVPNR